MPKDIITPSKASDKLSMSDLTIVQNDFTVNEDGEAFISQTKIAELCGVSQQAIGKYISGCTLKVNDINQLSHESLESVVGHYAFDSSAKNDTAVAFYRTIAKAGAKAFIYHQAGYSINAEKPKTQLEMLAEGFAKMAEIEKENKLLHLKVDRIEATLDDIQVSHQFFTVTAYIKLNRLPTMNVRECAKIGRAASKLCKESGIKLGTVPDGRWGSVNQYPHHILEEVFLSQEKSGIQS